MDLLGSIMTKMEKPPSASEKEKKLAKQIQAMQDKEMAKEKKQIEKFKADAGKKMADFLDDPTQHSLKFPPQEKLLRTVLHEVAEAAGLLSFSFGTEGQDRHTVLFRKEAPPSDEELQALRNGETYDPALHKRESVSVTTPNEDVRQPKAPPPSGNYQQKYKHILGGLECAEQTAVKMQANKSFGYVPSANKRDLRSIEQTLIDIRLKKKRISDDNEQQGQPAKNDTLAHTTSSSSSTVKRLKLDGDEVNKQGDPVSSGTGASSITHFGEPS